jgi:hypothetical protein
MEMTGQQRIPAPRETVWKALNDPNVLEACIPGCQGLVKTSDTQMTATAVIKVGPVTAKFQGAVTLSDLDPPNGYRITGEGQGGVAGFARGGAIVRLEADGDGTILHYDVSADVGGKLSQLGGRLIDATAKKLSGAFFKRFAEEIEAQYGENSSGVGVPHQPATPAIAAEPSVANNRSHAEPPRRPRPAPMPADVTPGIFSTARLVGLLALAAVLGICWYFFVGTLQTVSPTDGTWRHVSPDFASGVILLIVAAIGYLFGRDSRRSCNQTRSPQD